LGVIFSGSFINELDNFTDEGLEAINQKLSELRGPRDKMRKLIQEPYGWPVLSL
jgi:hypothetical protein